MARISHPSYAMNTSSEEDKLDTVRALAILLWMVIGLTVYLTKLLLLPGRIDRVLRFFQSLMN